LLDYRLVSESREANLNEDKLILVSPFIMQHINEVISPKAKINWYRILCGFYYKLLSKLWNNPFMAEIEARDGSIKLFN
jgi:hypothetical protein